MTMGGEASARLATDHLIRLGHRRIGIIAGPEEYSLSDWRKNGCKSAMEAANFSTDSMCASFDLG